MKKEWSRSWKASKQPRKQRKYLYNAPLHIARKFMSVVLSKTLKGKHSKKNIPIRKGDKIKIVRGQFKGKVGKVERVDIMYKKVFIEGINFVKKSGDKVPVGIHPSNLMITELNLDDKMRRKSLERK